MFDRGFDGQAGASWRHWLEQEAVHVAAVDQVHQHLAVVTASCNDRHQPGRL